MMSDTNLDGAQQTKQPITKPNKIYNNIKEGDEKTVVPTMVSKLKDEKTSSKKTGDDNSTSDVGGRKAVVVNKMYSRVQPPNRAYFPSIKPNGAYQDVHRKAILTRRTNANNYGVVNRLPQAMSSSSRLSERAGGGYYPDPYSARYAPPNIPYQPRTNAVNQHVNQQRYADRAVNFYRSFNATQVELQFVISGIRHRSLTDVMSDISRRVFLSERERYIHTSQGTIVNNINDFEDGGIYFFGPPHIFDLDDYNHFHKTNSPSLAGSTNTEDEVKVVRRGSRLSNQSLENRSLENRSLENRSNRSNSDVDGVGGGRSLKRRRMIKVMINHNPHSMTSFLIDESKHRSVVHVLSDMSDQLQLKRDRLERIVTQVGRRIQRVEEFFLSKDDHYIALITNYDPYAATQSYGPYAAQYPPSDPYDPMNRVPGYYDHPYLRPAKVDINGEMQVFDPPANDYYDQIYRRGNEPQGQLQLEWIYGYNGKNCRNNILLLPTEEILYFVAKVAIILNDEQQQQRFYTEHTDEIRSIAQHPNLWVVATGQTSGGTREDIGHVRIWDSKILVTLNVLKFDEINMSVECMDFCEGDNGIRLATVSNDCDSNWYLTVWDWEDSIKLSCSEPYGNEFAELDIEFDPLDNNQVVTCGKEHLFFWDVSRREAMYESGYFNEYDTPEYVTCLDFNMDGQLVSGDSNGMVHVWDARLRQTIMIVHTLHTGSIISLKALFGDYVITGGGADRKLTLINCEAMSTESEFELPEPLGGVVAVTPVFAGFNGGEQNFDYLRLVAGTSTNCILKGSLNEGFECIMKGVSSEPSIAIHPVEDMFISASSDTTISAWSTQSKTDVWEIKQDHPCSAADFNSTGTLVAIGSTSGRWFVYNSTDGEQIASFQCDRSAVTCISYSPEGDFVAVGMESGIVFFYKIHEELDYKYLFSNKSSRDMIQSIDWSVDGRMVRIVNSKFDMFYWNMHGRRLENNRNILKDIQFDTETVPMSYQTSGVWMDNHPSQSFQTTDRSQNSTMFVVGSDAGGVRLYQYPCDVETNAHFKRLNGNCFHEVNIHSSPLSKVGFLLNDRSVLTSGLLDYCIAQWKIVREKPAHVVEDRRFQRRYTGQLMDNLSMSNYSKIKSQQLGPSPRHKKDIKEDGQGSLSRAQLSKRETVQSMLMRKSITDQ